MGGVTGVILANASLSVAMHDTQISQILIADTPIILASTKKPTWDSVPRDHLGPFVVGLIDGEGSFQVNHWRKKILQYRMEVKLSHKPGNLEMLRFIASTYGGTTRIVQRGKFVSWVISDTKVIGATILPLMAQYPPLTTRMHLQHSFVQQALEGMSVSDYIIQRGLKYDTPMEITPFTVRPLYFDSWLAGFIEANGSFVLRSGQANFSFSIEQANDAYLMQAILDFFGQSHLTVLQRGTIPTYYIEMYNGKAIEKMVNHLVSHPLLGHKYYQLCNVMENSKMLSHLRHHFWDN